MTCAPPDAKTVRQAITWRVALREHGNDPAFEQRCMQWRNACPSHELAWQRVVHLDQELDLRAVPAAGIALRTLETSHKRLQRRQALKLLGGFAMVGSAAWLAKDLDLISPWSSDYATATGERRHITLADGTRLQLNTRSAVDVAFNGQQLVVELRRGELMLDCRQTLHPQFPVHVYAKDALLQAFDSRVALRLEGDCVHASFSHGRLAAQQADTGGWQWLEPDQAWRVTRDGVQREQPASMDALAWTEGLIVTRDMRLADFLAQVSRYRHGYLTCSDNIADMRLSGVFRLDDPEQLVRLLPRTLPVQLRELTRLWIRVERLS